MLTDPKRRSQIDALWDKFWSGGLTNPQDAIEQFSDLLFLKRINFLPLISLRYHKKFTSAFHPSVASDSRQAEMLFQGLLRGAFEREGDGG
jgi:type I restriction enzyme M protein